ncbi:MAG: protein-L-isoaspartate O-methyltransferase [Proteobacteria bacterium]|nr:protein-L-isoaspartate O-methyltransferase [Pseudomonadota bacterium]MDA0994641.1 protein-L-isoaspartate O-methyltransferase [Pseudomonadota bacterium]
MNTDSARRQMVEQQIRPWAVSDANVLRAFDYVPRDLFVPANCTNVAYADAEIPLPHGQCMLRPSIEGRMVQSLEIQPYDYVLEIGTGTGYLTACLARNAGHVVSIDLFEDFTARALTNLASVEVDNVTIRCMDAMNELPTGQFDAIAVSGSIDRLDDRFVSALKPGGRLFVVVGESPAKSALLVKRAAVGVIEIRELFETDIPALITTKKSTDFRF